MIRTTKHRPTDKRESKQHCSLDEILELIDELNPQKNIGIVFTEDDNIRMTGAVKSYEIKDYLLRKFPQEEGTYTHAQVVKTIKPKNTTYYIMIVSGPARGANKPCYRAILTYGFSRK